ncbi:MAG: DUF6295 family protein [Actinomycetota bacterium]
MCSYVSYNEELVGSVYANGEWMTIRKGVVGIEHPIHASIEHAIVLDLREGTGDPSARVAVELDPASARTLAESVLAALDRT